MSSTDTVFAGSIPALYDRFLGPLLFQPYALVAADRAKAIAAGKILETAAGTGIVTNALADALPAAEIVATDLNEAMLDVAAAKISSDRVRFETADALDLPFADESFDLVICQFGVMFYPDKVKGNREARRVLRDGGSYISIIWDRLDANPVSQAAHLAIAELFPDDPPKFLSRTPFGYWEEKQVEADLRSAGFQSIEIERVAETNLPISPENAALGLTQGSPLRAEIEERDASRLGEATEAAARAIRSLGYGNPLAAPMSALIVTAVR